jgi:hypothetical protein
VVPRGDRSALVAEIVDDLRKRNWQQTPGDVGHVYFIHALAEAGRSDVLHRVYARDGLGSYPSVGNKAGDGEPYLHNNPSVVGDRMMQCPAPGVCRNASASAAGGMPTWRRAAGDHFG